MIKKILSPLHYSFVFVKNNFLQKYKTIIYFFIKKTSRIINIKINFKNIKLYSSGQIAKLLYTSEFEKDILSIYSKYLKKGDIIIDVGANIGLYSIIAEKFIGKNGKIYAFEPSEEVFLKFKKNIKLNNSKIIDLNKKAVSKKNGKVALVVDKLLGDGYSYISKNKLLLDTYSHVESITLDYFFKKNSLKKVNFIKIDVEGGELSVLEGAKNILLNNKNLVVLLENSNEGLKRFGNNQKDLYLFLKNMGFKIAAWDNNSKKWTNKISQTKKIGNIWAYKENTKDSFFDLKP